MKKKDFLKSIRNLFASSAVIACSLTHAMQEEQYPKPELRLSSGTPGSCAREIVTALQPISDPNKLDPTDPLTKTQTIVVSNYNLDGFRYFGYENGYVVEGPISDTTRHDDKTKQTNSGLVFFVTPSSRMPDLRVLILSNNQITSIEHISSITAQNLERLDLTDNHIARYRSLRKAHFPNLLFLLIDDHGPEYAATDLNQMQLNNRLINPRIKASVDFKFYFHQQYPVKHVTMPEFICGRNKVYLG